METKVKMPEPVEMDGDMYGPSRGYTTQQLEDYAAARVAEALEHVGAAVRPSSLVNSADILASDRPGEVIKKLDAAWRALDGGWQPIDTAPTDGTWILAWRGPCHGLGEWGPMVIVCWHEFDGEGSWSWPDDVYDPWTESGQTRAAAKLEDESFYSSNEFTHWQPLPEPPAS